jgi:hypothetical protein
MADKTKTEANSWSIDNVLPSKDTVLAKMDEVKHKVTDWYNKSEDSAGGLLEKFDNLPTWQKWGIGIATTLGIAGISYWAYSRWASRRNMQSAEFFGRIPKTTEQFQSLTRDAEALHEEYFNKAIQAFNRANSLNQADSKFQMFMTTGMYYLGAYISTISVKETKKVALNAAFALPSVAAFGYIPSSIDVPETLIGPMLTAPEPTMEELDKCVISMLRMKSAGLVYEDA